MFSSTAYEALYQYIGLELHARIIEVLTSQQIFMAAVLMIFASLFFSTTVEFFSRYLPSSVVKRRSVPLSKYVKVVACLLAGLSILRVGSDTGVKSMKGQSWATNSYILAKSHSVKESYRVSFVFDLLSRSAEETSRLINKIVDEMFRSTNSELEAPSFFYKAVMYAGAETLDDPRLRGTVKQYTDDCVTRVLPMLGGSEGLDRMDSLFRSGNAVDDTLRGLAIESNAGPTSNCLTLKNQVQTDLLSYTKAKSQNFRSMMHGYVGNPLDETKWLNLQTSMTLVDLYLEDHEGFAGIQKGSQPAAGSARIFQYLNRFFSWDGMMSLIGRETHGAALAAERSQEFSENLTRAPHVAGFIKLCLVALFPWLVFPIVAGHWKILIWWFTAYSSVLIWTPIWTLLYHVMMGVSLSAETLAAFGELSDGISLYSAKLITSRMNYMYAVYSWLQLLIGAGFTGSILWFARPILTDAKEETTPEFLGEARHLTTMVGRSL